MALAWIGAALQILASDVSVQSVVAMICTLAGGRLIQLECHAEPIGLSDTGSAKGSGSGGLGNIPNLNQVGESDGSTWVQFLTV